MLSAILGSVTVVAPAVAVAVAGSAEPKRATCTGPLTPAAPWWMWPRVGAVMPRHSTAKVTRAPCTRTSALPLASGSPTAGPPGTGTSLRPDNVAVKNRGAKPFGELAAAGDPVAVGVEPWSWA